MKTKASAFPRGLGVGKLILRLALVFVVLGETCRAGIIYPQAPNGGQQLVYGFVAEIVRSHPDTFSGVPFDDLTIGVPYQMFSVNLTNLTSGHLISAAKSGGIWAYPVIHGTNIVGSAQLLADEKTGDALKCTGLMLSDVTQDALRVAERLPKLKKHDYSLRYLGAAPLLFRALWLHSDTDDIIIPLPPTFGRWKEYHVYSEHEMLKLLKPAAEKKLKEPGRTFD